MCPRRKGSSFKVAIVGACSQIERESTLAAKMCFWGVILIRQAQKKLQTQKAHDIRLQWQRELGRTKQIHGIKDSADEPGKAVIRERNRS